MAEQDGQEPRVAQYDETELLNRHFETIAKIMKSRVHIALINQYRLHTETYGLEKIDHTNEFRTQGKTFSELEEELEKAKIIRPDSPKSAPQEYHVVEFIVKYGLPMNTVKDILARDLGYKEIML